MPFCFAFLFTWVDKQKPPVTALPPDHQTFLEHLKNDTRKTKTGDSEDRAKKRVSTYFFVLWKLSCLQDHAHLVRMDLFLVESKWFLHVNIFI
jgi:hypothetical protein